MKKKKKEAVFVGRREPGPHGKTLEMNSLTSLFQWSKKADRKPTVRDRTLRGKARRKARKEANKQPIATP